MLQPPYIVRPRHGFRAARSIVGVLGLLMTLALVVSCRDGHSKVVESGEAVAPAAVNDDSEQFDPQPPEYFHSPFALHVAGGRFDTVAFKDVGLRRVEGQADTMLLEVIAESLAYEIAAEERLGYTANLDYDEARSNPANHLHCGLHHLYIDLWQAEDPARWGYSLWSGCSELDNFAHVELPRSENDDDLTAYVAPLAASIVESLVEASQSDCFHKQC